MEKLLESFKTLAYLGTQVLFFVDIHHTYTENEDYLNKIKFKGHYSNIPFARAISGSLLNYAHIISCAFFDEYNREVIPTKHPAYADRILKLKKITKPVMERLNKWADFKEYRNSILAHNVRIKGQSVFDKDFKPVTFNTPHTNGEVILLSRLMIMITTSMAEEFPELVGKLDVNENLVTKMNFNYPSIDVGKEISEIQNQVNAVKSSL